MPAQMNRAGGQFGTKYEVVETDRVSAAFVFLFFFWEGGSHESILC